MTPAAWHALFDILAWAAALGVGLWLKPRVAFPAPIKADQNWSDLAALVAGASIGAYGFGTFNLWASGQAGLARSIEGAIAGGIVGVELFKYLNGVTSRTGARYAAPLALGIAVGRIGCFLGGLDDFTYGTPTALPWAYDFGDRIPRHPVQLYESAAMALFLVLYLVQVLRRNGWWVRNGFHLAVGYYGAQRFLWEFLKPYGTIVGPLTIFHLLSGALAIYALVMLRTSGAFSKDDEHSGT